MSGHGHGHSHGGGCDDGDDHVTEDERGFAYSLYLKIDTERVQCLNEVEDGSAKYVFKAWDQRLDKEKVLVRPTLKIFLFPFTRPCFSDMGRSVRIFFF